MNTELTLMCLHRGFLKIIIMEINILYHTKETEKYKESSINYDWRELDVIPCYLNSFYAAHPIYNNGNEYTEILVGSNSIICVLEYKDFVKVCKEYKT